MLETIIFLCFIQAVTYNKGYYVIIFDSTVYHEHPIFGGSGF